MPECRDMKPGQLFRWQNSLYEYIGRLDQSSDEVFEVAVYTSYGEYWQLYENKMRQKFNPYCEVKPLTKDL